MMMEQPAAAMAAVAAAMAEEAAASAAMTAVSAAVTAIAAAVTAVSAAVATAAAAAMAQEMTTMAAARAATVSPCRGFGRTGHGHHQYETIHATSREKKKQFFLALQRVPHTRLGRGLDTLTYHTHGGI
jgi:predicted YcjX-like family ATPase